ncbi:MAG: DNA polymerase III subunit chi [Colwellia sp.]|nr:DNA polymerase III subunit chi [Colwellia sp.]
MPTQVMFYILPDEDKTDASAINTSTAFYQACLQASYFYRQNQRVFIYTQDQKDAEQIDEMLWAFDSDSFVPHNLSGEGPKQGAAVEISRQVPRGRRPVLINLSNTVPDFASQFQLIVDFVPSDEALKQLARERFKTCRQWGFQVDNQAVSTTP